MNRPLETNRNVSIRPVAAVVAVPGRAMLPLPQGAAIYRQAPTMSPCRRRAAPSRQEPSIGPPAHGTSARPAVTRLRYFPHTRRCGLARSAFQIVLLAGAAHQTRVSADRLLFSGLAEAGVSWKNRDRKRLASSPKGIRYH